MESMKNPIQRNHLMRFFKTDEGNYGYGDLFLGLKVPQTRAVVKQYKDLPLQEIQILLDSQWHEVRLCGFLILVSQFERYVKKTSRGDEPAIQRTDEIVDFYIANSKKANNWDLVDLSCYKILGKWLLLPSRLNEKEKLEIFDALAYSDNLWQQRISMVSTMATIMAGDPAFTFRYAEIHLHHVHDLMHKAVGWMLREVGKRCGMDILRGFLELHAHEMPRTALRYAIEHMELEEKKQWMNK